MSATVSNARGPSLYRLADERERERESTRLGEGGTCLRARESERERETHTFWVLWVFTF